MARVLEVDLVKGRLSLGLKPSYFEGDLALGSDVEEGSDADAPLSDFEDELAGSEDGEGSGQEVRVKGGAFPRGGLRARLIHQLPRQRPFRPACLLSQPPPPPLSILQEAGASEAQSDDGQADESEGEESGDEAGMDLDDELAGSSDSD